MQNSKYDLVLPHAESAAMVKKHGMETFVNWIRTLFPEYSLYSCSLDWVESHRYICKFRGGQGDLIIGWRENMI